MFFFSIRAVYAAQYYNNGHNKSHRRDLKCTSFFPVAHLFTLYYMLSTCIYNAPYKYVYILRGATESAFGWLGLMLIRRRYPVVFTIVYVYIITI